MLVGSGINADTVATSKRGKMSFSQRPKAGTPVHVEFDGYVTDHVGDYEHFWQVAVSDVDDPDGLVGRLHYVNWQADSVTERERNVQVGQVWIDEDGTNWFVYNVNRLGAVWFVSEEAEVLSKTDFFEKHPMAQQAKVTF